MISGAPPLANAPHHSEHLADRVAMLAMRTMIGLLPPAALGPAGRTAFDELMTKTPTGWWCHPADAVASGAMLYLHGATPPTTVDS